MRGGCSEEAFECCALRAAAARERLRRSRYGKSRVCPVGLHPLTAHPPFLSGIAASPAIAVDILRMLREAGAPLDTPNPSFNPNRAPSIVPKSGYRGLKMSRAEFWKVKDQTRERALPLT